MRFPRRVDDKATRPAIANSQRTQGTCNAVLARKIGGARNRMLHKVLFATYLCRLNISTDRPERLCTKVNLEGPAEIVKELKKRVVEFDTWNILCKYGEDSVSLRRTAQGRGRLGKRLYLARKPLHGYRDQLRCRSPAAVFGADRGFHDPAVAVPVFSGLPPNSTDKPFSVGTHAQPSRQFRWRQLNTLDRQADSYTIIEAAGCTHG